MRKITLAIATAVIASALIGCGTGTGGIKTAQPTEAVSANAAADMSEFTENSEEEKDQSFFFDEYSVDDMITDLEGGASEIVLIADLDDSTNKAMIDSVNEAAREAGIRAYLINYDSMSEDDKQKMIDFYGSQFNTDEEGNAVVEAPTLFAVREGTVSLTLIGPDTSMVAEAFNRISD